VTRTKEVEPRNTWRHLPSLSDDDGKYDDTAPPLEDVYAGRFTGHRVGRRWMLHQVSVLRDNEQKMNQMTKAPRERVQMCLANPTVDLAIAIIVAINCVVLGIQLQDDSKNSSVDIGFNVIYLSEFTLRVYAHGHRYFQSLMNVVDTVIVACGAVESAAFLLSVEENDQVDGRFGVLRIFRFLRILRVVRLVSLFKSLVIIIGALFNVTKNLSIGLILLLIVIYLFALIAVKVVAEDPRYLGDEVPDHVFMPIRVVGDSTGSVRLSAEDSREAWKNAVGHLFGSLLKAMFTLFKVMTLEGWPHISLILSQVDWKWNIYFIVFVTLTSFCLMQIVYALIIDNVFNHSALIEKDRAEKAKAKVRRRFKQLERTFTLVDESDAGYPGFINVRSLEGQLRDPRVRRRMRQMGVDVDELEQALRLIRDAGSNVPHQDVWNPDVVSIDELVYACDRISERSLWAKDVHAVLYDVRYAFTKLSKRIGELEEHFRDIWKATSILHKVTKSVQQAAGLSESGRGWVHERMLRDRKRIIHQQELIGRARRKVEHLQRSNACLQSEHDSLAAIVSAAEAEVDRLHAAGGPHVSDVAWDVSRGSGELCIG